MFGRSKPSFEDVKEINTVTQIWLLWICL